MIHGSKVGEIYYNSDSNKGFIVWDDLFIDIMCGEARFGPKFVQDMEAEIADFRAKVEECTADMKKINEEREG